MNNMNNMKYSNNTNCQMDKNTLLQALRAEDFVVYEAALYLNTHPKDRSALEYFKEHKICAEKLRREYEAIYGPLTINAVNGDSWSWINSPWPWEKEAN